MSELYSITEKIISKLTSVSYSPRLKYNIGLGLVETKFSDIGTKFNIEAYDELVNSEIFLYLL